MIDRICLITCMHHIIFLEVILMKLCSIYKIYCILHVYIFKYILNFVMFINLTIHNIKRFTIWISCLKYYLYLHSFYYHGFDINERKKCRGYVMRVWPDTVEVCWQSHISTIWFELIGNESVKGGLCVAAEAKVEVLNDIHIHSVICGPKPSNIFKKVTTFIKCYSLFIKELHLLTHYSVSTSNYLF